MKYALNIFLITLSVITYLVSNFVNEFDGKYALFTKEFDMLLFIIFEILLFSVILKNIRLMIYAEGNPMVSFFVIITLIAISLFSFHKVGRNIPDLSKDIIEGTVTNSFEISDKSYADKGRLGNSKYYLIGTTLEGKEITFEVGSSTYWELFIINPAKVIEIEYWKHSETLYGWKLVIKKA